MGHPTPVTANGNTPAHPSRQLQPTLIWKFVVLPVPGMKLGLMVVYM